MTVCTLFKTMAGNPFVDFMSSPLTSGIANLLTIYHGVVPILFGLIAVFAIRSRSKAKLIENLRKEREKQETVIANLQTEIDKLNEHIEKITPRLPEAVLNSARREQADNNLDLVHRALAGWMAEEGEAIAQILFMRAEWTLARAVGEARTKGLVASHAYCVAASVFSTDLAEAILLRKDAEAMVRDLGGQASPLAESLRDFDEEARAYLGAKYDQNAVVAALALFEEAIRRYQHAHYRAALLAIQVAEIWLQANEGRLSANMFRLLYWKSAILQRLGRYHEALHATEESIRGYQGLPTLDPKKEWLYRNQIDLAQILYDLGRYQEALREAQTVVNARTNNQDFGAEHPQTLVSRLRAAKILERLGRYEDALHEAQAVVKARTGNRDFGTEHHDTLTSRYLVANILERLGRYEEALRETQAVVKARTNNQDFGAEHPETLTSRHLIAIILERLGRYEEALREAQAVVKARTSNQDFGTEHPHTLTSRFLVAQILDHLGRYEEALREAQAIIEAETGDLGADHPSTLAARHLAAEILDHLGRYKEALREAQAVLKARVDSLNIGPTHPETLDTQALVEKIREHMR